MTEGRRQMGRSGMTADTPEEQDIGYGRSYLSLSSGNDETVFPPLDPPTDGSYYEERQREERLSWGFKDNQYISDMTDDDRVIFEHRKRRMDILKGSFLLLIGSICIVLFIIFLSEGSVLITSASVIISFIFWVFIIGSAKWALERKFRSEKDRAGKRVIIPNCVVELTDKYVSIMFKGSSSSEEYLIYYDQIRDIEVDANERVERKLPGESGRLRMRMARDPEHVMNALYPKGTPDDYIVGIRLKKKTAIEPRKVMTYYFEEDSWNPRRLIASEKVLISIRPDEQGVFRDRVKRKLEDRTSYEGQEFYPEWR